MTIESGWLVFLTGCLGGVFCELLHWWDLRTKPEWPAYAYWPRYWVLTLAMLAAGGIVCWLYFGQRADGVVALHVGLSTPLILQKLVASVPERPGAKAAVVPQPSLKSFFTW
jgi:hypothetical protein